MIWRKAVFIFLIVFCLSPLGSAPAALILGIGLALTIGTPFPYFRGRPTWLLFEASVILLGFGADVRAVYQVLKGRVLFIIAGMAVFLIIGYIAGRLSASGGKRGIFGSEEFQVRDGEISSLASIGLILSVLALVAFPFISDYLLLTPDQAGVWSAVAAPGVASAIGVSQTISVGALSVTVPLILVRLLLMFAAALGTYRAQPGAAKIAFPWLVLGVMVLRTYAPVSVFPSIFDSFVNLGNAGIVVTLFLLGTNLSLANLKKIETKAGIAVTAMWVAFAAVSLWAVLRLL
jgi:uncharacterized membrane protein YadS